MCIDLEYRFGVLMLLGSVVTFYFVPYSRVEEDRILSLEDIENGKGWTRPFRSVFQGIFQSQKIPVKRALVLKFGD